MLQKTGLIPEKICPIQSQMKYPLKEEEDEGGAEVITKEPIETIKTEVREGDFMNVEGIVEAEEAIVIEAHISHTMPILTTEII